MTKINHWPDLLGKPALNLAYPNAAFELARGVGMTSQRTRDRLVNRLSHKDISNTALLNVMRLVPRHLFLDEAMASRAYEDTALPIGFGQTISQPWVVAKMTEWLLEGRAVASLGRVLEIGTGSGYQTAVLSLLADEVFSVERIAPLSLRAQSILAQLQLTNIHYDISDGHWGWLAMAPFDAIISAASPSELPMELIHQLKVGGRLVIPIGGVEQKLYGFEKTAQGITETCLAEVLFVPMKQGVEV